MPNPLPDYRASLSKYYQAREHHPLIAAIQNDIPEDNLRKQFGENLYATGKQRYLIVRNGLAVRDKLVDFVHEEGDFTEPVKMVMYFLFMFRDPRYRDFICNVVGSKNGKWNTRVFQEEDPGYFQGVGGHKAFTNLRQFLFQTGVLDERTFKATMPPLDTWFPAAVEIAAQSISDREARKSFLRSPHGFLIRHKVHALLNATPDELASLEIQGSSDESDDSLPAIELPAGTTDATATTDQLRTWNRKPPTRSKLGTITVETDPAALERANSQHYLLECRISELCKEQGLVPRSNVHIDLAVDSGDRSVVFEMKSCSLDAIRSQLRRAISQLLEYRYLYRQQLKSQVILCAVLERSPRGGIAWLSGYLEYLGIGLIWKNDRDDRLNCNDGTKKLLSGILPQLETKNF